jgi:hypothetical protein
MPTNICKKTALNIIKEAVPISDNSGEQENYTTTTKQQIL